MYYNYINDDLTVMKHCHCLTDGGHGIMILPDGKVGQCEHFYNKDYIDVLFFHFSPSYVPSNIRSYHKIWNVCNL